VCLTQIDEREAPERADFRGQTYYFDSDRCRRVFEQAPDDFAGKIAQIVYGDQGHPRRGEANTEGKGKANRESAEGKGKGL